MITTYKIVRTATIMLDKGKPTQRRAVQRDVVASGLTWQAAKALRQADRTLNIVPERAVVPPLQVEEPVP